MLSWLDFAVSFWRSTFCHVHAITRANKKFKKEKKSVLQIWAVMKLKLCDSQLVPSWMQGAKGVPTHTDGSPAEKPYKKTGAKEKRQENMPLSRTCALHRPHTVPSAWSEVSIHGLLETALGWSPRRGFIVTGWPPEARHTVEHHKKASR